jgi:hypothetical protein
MDALRAPFRSGDVVGHPVAETLEQENRDFAADLSFIRDRVSSKYFERLPARFVDVEIGRDRFAVRQSQAPARQSDS